MKRERVGRVVYEPVKGWALVRTEMNDGSVPMVQTPFDFGLFKESVAKMRERCGHRRGVQIVRAELRITEIPAKASKPAKKKARGKQ